MKAFTDEVIELPNPLHTCCDICSLLCKCHTCYQSVQLKEGELSEFCDDTGTIENFPKKHLSKQKWKKWKRDLVDYRDQLCAVEGIDAPLLFTKDIISGVSSTLISTIINNSRNITCVDDLCNLGVMSIEHAGNILDIVEKNL